MRVARLALQTWKGFSPVWTIRWVLRAEFEVNACKMWSGGEDGAFPKCQNVLGNIGFSS